MAMFCPLMRGGSGELKTYTANWDANYMEYTFNPNDLQTRDEYIEFQKQKQFLLECTRGNVVYDIVVATKGEKGAKILDYAIDDSGDTYFGLFRFDFGDIRRDIYTFVLAGKIALKG